MHCCQSTMDHGPATEQERVMKQRMIMIASELSHGPHEDQRGHTALGLEEGLTKKEQRKEKLNEIDAAAEEEER